jgi:hypothetical protein
MLNTFKNFNIDGLDIDELVVLHSFGTQLRSHYASMQLEEPEYIGVQLNSLTREIGVRTADKREARVREIKSRLESLKSPDQKRAELEKELASLTASGS